MLQRTVLFIFDKTSGCFLSFCQQSRHKRRLNAIGALHLYAVLITFLRKLCIFAAWNGIYNITAWNGYIIYFLNILPYRQWW